MESWFAAYKIPLGSTVKVLINYLQDNASGFFDVVTDTIAFTVDGLTHVLLTVPPLLLVALIAVLAWRLQRSLRLAAFVVAAFVVIIYLGYWTQTVETISLVGFATLTSVVIGVPLGIAAAHRPWLYTILRPVLDLMQTLPTFVYLIPTLVLFGLGAAPGLISTVIFAIAAPVRLTHLGITSVPPPLREAAEAFGATKRQLLWKVEVPHALPTIMAGVTQCIMLSLSMVVIAALVVGCNLLGDWLVRRADRRGG